MNSNEYHAKRIILIAATLCMSASLCFSQNSEQDSSYKRYFVGTSLFLPGNLNSTNKPDFVQLNFGYRITNVDVISVKFPTWIDALQDNSKSQY